MAGLTCRTYLRNVIGAGTNEKADAIREEGLEFLDSLVDFEKDDIKTLCRSVRRPGGTIVNPTHNPNNPVAGIPERISNPGFNIPAIVETRLIQAAYTAKIFNRMGRTLTQDALALTVIRSYKEHMDTVLNHTDPERMPTISKTFNITKILDLLPGHLRERMGARGVALSYVIREDAAPGNVPQQRVIGGIAQSTSAPFENNIMDELIAYTPHTGAGWDEDNASVLQVLVDLVTNTHHASSIKPSLRTRNGRSAYFALTQHNMGNSKFQTIIDAAEKFVLQNPWNGKNQRYTLKVHINRHREAHNDMTWASAHVNYALPHERTRVSRLLSSITSTDANIVSAKVTIKSSPTKADDFEEAAEFLLECNPKSKPQENEYHRVSAYQTSGGGRGGGRYGGRHGGRNIGRGRGRGRGRGGRQQRGGGRFGGRGRGRGQRNDGNCDRGVTGVELRYHIPSEFNALNQAQYEELRDWRQQTGNYVGIPESNHNHHNISAAQQNENDKSMIEMLQQQIATLKSENDNEKKRKANPLQPPPNFSQRGR